MECKNCESMSTGDSQYCSVHEEMLGINTTVTNQASEDKPINQHLVCLWQLQDIEETIADASPEELVDLHSKLVALSTDITESVQSAIRTEKLKLLAELDKSMPTAEQLTTKYGYHMPDKQYGYKLALHDIREVIGKLEAEL